ncbi:transposase [Nioella sediminis]|jgi:ACT domain-containing protein|uniref:transposase n=1 Tax=Nioella sediminis TaxID=1912092 RepID=UPI0008FD25C8|nr:transposase [Nioella sediminis]
MKPSLADEQITAKIKKQEVDEKTDDLCRRHEISQGTFYRYKSKYGGMAQQQIQVLATGLKEQREDRISCVLFIGVQIICNEYCAAIAIAMHTS